MIRDFDDLQYARGYLITPRELNVDLVELASWNEHTISDYTVHVHPGAAIHRLRADDSSDWVLLGHAYDPWNREHDESVLLDKLDSAYRESESVFLSALDRLSGRFVLFYLGSGGTGFAVQDATGLKNLYFATTARGTAFSSHSQLLADAIGLERDPEIDRLVDSWFYSMGIRHLPGLRTPFIRMRMLSANTLLRLPDLEVERFFPRGPHPESEDLVETARTIGDVFAASFDVLARKQPLALSLSMGVDSRTSLAASRAHRETIHYFSYISNNLEKKDALGARRLCDYLGIEHTVYQVPIDKVRGPVNSEFCAVLDRNAAHIRKPTPSERSKIRYLVENAPSNVLEIRSPVSEIGRAIYCKRLHMDRMPDQLTPRQMSNLYKRNFYDREMLRSTDRAFRQFIETTGFGRDFYNYEQHDMFYWEHRNSAWASLSMQDHDVIYEPTVIYNNRDVLKLLLSPPLRDRIADRLHHEIIRYLWPDALQFPFPRTNTPATMLRGFAERAFFAINQG